MNGLDGVLPLAAAENNISPATVAGSAEPASQVKRNNYGKRNLPDTERTVTGTGFQRDVHRWRPLVIKAQIAHLDQIMVLSMNHSLSRSQNVNHLMMTVRKTDG